MKGTRFLRILLPLLTVGMLINICEADDGNPVFQESSGVIELDLHRANWTPTVYPMQWEGWQVTDLAALTILLISGSLLVFFRRGSRAITIHLTVSLLYLGLFRGGCVCPIGAISNISVAMANSQFAGRVILAIFTIPLIFSVLFGRTFCGTVCPLGAVQQLIAKEKPTKVPKKIDLILSVVPIITLISTVVFAATGRFYLSCHMDPYKPIFWQGKALFQKAASITGPQFTEHGIITACGVSAWVALIIALILGRYITRFFCRFICPFGVLLGIAGLLGFKRRRISKENCVYCNRCEQRCPVQAIKICQEDEVAELSSFKCIECGRCSTACKTNAIE